VPRPPLVPMRVFVACTGDLCKEREAVETEIDSVNRDFAVPQGMILQLLDWHDVSSSMGLPEEVILGAMSVEEWDILIGILWHRFGSPTGVLDSETGRPYKGGTEQEFKLAYKLYRETGRPIIRFYHCKSNLPYDQLDPDQLKSVKAFLAEFEPDGAHPGLVEYYTDLGDFSDRVRRDLIAALKKPTSVASPAPHDQITGSTRPGAAHLDQQALRQYLELCSQWQADEFDWQGLLRDMETQHQQLLREHLVNSGLLSLCGETGQPQFTDEGALFCCLPAYIPRYRLHVDVQVIDEREVSGKASKCYFYGSALGTFFKLHKQLEELWRPRSGRPDIRTSSGGEVPESDYPQLAIVEALANFIIHRDYLEDDRAYIILREDRVEFLNPGRSERSIPELWATMLSQKRLKPKYGRNQRLIEAFGKARINQLEGGGLMRVYSALDQDQCYQANGQIGLQLTNYDDENRFGLVIYKRPPPQEMDAVLSRRMSLAKQELALRMKREPGS